jgi:hypothetical protein
LCEVQRIVGQCPHRDADDVSPPAGEWPFPAGGEPGAREARTLDGAAAYDIIERQAWLDLARVVLEVEHYEA